MPDLLAMTERQQIAYLLAATNQDHAPCGEASRAKSDEKRGSLRAALQQLPVNKSLLRKEDKACAPAVRVTRVEATISSPSNGINLHLVCGGPEATKLASLRAFKKSALPT